MELKHINDIEKATKKGQNELFRLGIGLIFIVGVMLYTSTLELERGSMLLVMAAMIGGYMAMNIGANDVANNVGPAVGSHALTLGGALTIAAIFEASGALIAGGDVVTTIRSGIIDPTRLPAGDVYIWLMMAALLAGALWLNIATAVGAPVSTTHSIVGAILGAGAAAAGLDVVNWDTMTEIVASWVVSPVLGGVFAAGFLYLIKRSITYKQDMVEAAVRMVPLLVALMAWSFTTYLMLKGLNKIWKVGVLTATIAGFGVGALVYASLRPFLRARMGRIENSKESVNQLFTVPLIFSAALLSFAHGANDVANAIGPLAAIYNAVSSGAGTVADKAAIPLWVMMVGGLGISIGLALFGPKVIRTVGSEITELDKMRAYCIAMSATITVIVASQMGLPVSSTHIAVGGVFGVGFLREYLKANYARMEEEIRAHHPEGDLVAINAFLARFKAASVQEKGEMLVELKLRSKMRMDPANFSKLERKGLKRVYRQELVKRSQLLKIAAAWVITVPASAILAAMLFFMIKGMLG
ncbi:inorganic phosphate transporter [Azovibrio restrictus]|uniref:inorganic phosphate transporter n=1 Tax=Azovibrio restrictus TaxID=146938 RepID=UPI0026EDFCE9|nr:inorganic phosphate transporter [Azovibrio restrictus]